MHARINSAGFHDVEHALEKPPGTLRIVLLGDSMLAGMQVPLEQSFAAASSRCSTERATAGRASRW